MKLLNEVHVPETINEVQLEDFVSAILLKDQITFSDEDFPIDGRSHNKVLYIAAKCKGKEVSRVLIDNGSALNLCPLSTLHRLGIKEESIRTSKVTVRLFDGMKKDVMGDITLEVEIGPVPFLIDFQVVDIPRTFNLLLGRPWIHMAGAAPSSLHQKVRFAINGKLITVHGETDFVTYKESAVPYVEPEVTEEPSYHSFEMISMVHVPAGSMLIIPKLPKSSIMAGKVLCQYGFTPGGGLGMRTQGIREPIFPLTTTKKYGLGYIAESLGDHHGGRGQSQKNHKGYGSRGDRVITPSAWRGGVKRRLYHQVHIKESFPGPSKLLQEEDVYVIGEPDLRELFEEHFVNVIIEEAEDTHPLE